jgi:hypothetical protein
MRHTAPQPDALAALRQLTLTEVEQRIADLDAERAALALLRRSLAARDRARRRAGLVHAPAPERVAPGRT